MQVQALVDSPPVGQRAQRVLVVDDEPDVLASLRAILIAAGYDVTCSSSLRQALAALEDGSYHLVLTDLYLGDEELGYRLAECAREQRPSVPVVVLTGRPSFNGAQEALRTRVAEIVVKPVEPHAILATCRRAIHEAGLTRRAQKLEAQNRVLASVLPRAIEVKDPLTRGHADRVVHYADSLARRCGVSREDRCDLRFAALFHDVGKIGIPNRILTKPGPLTTEEREIIKRHPGMGYEILEPLEDSENVRLWVYQHHERWDGRGYPEGLGGEDVALPGRILILAEVFDALAQKRSYKDAWDTAKIATFFRDQAGRQFDPELSQVVADGLDRMGTRFFAESPNQLF